MLGTAVTLGTTMLVLTAVTLLGVWYSRGRISTLEEFVSARDIAGVTSLTASLVASTLGTWILFSPAEAAVEFGGIAAVFGYALGLGLPLAAFTVVGVRVRRLVPHGHSVTEYVLARYGRGMYVLVLCVSVAYMFVFLAVEITGIAAALAIVAGVSPPLTATLIGLFVFVYTGYGGLIASIFTDTLQALVVLPLLVVGFAGSLVALGGADAIYARVVATDPALLTLTNDMGVRFGLYVGVALLGANMLNQGLWQRVYAAETDRTARRSFLFAAVAVVPIVILAGLFGLDAAALGLVEEGGHAAFFRVLVATAPDWVVLVVVVVAVLLVMTSVDTLLSGLASLALRDLPRVVDRLDATNDHDAAELWAARLLTGVFALGATVIGALQFSEIRLFLTVDLLCAATFVPVVAGLYTGEIPEWGAITAAAAGFTLGLALDPVARPLLVDLLPPAGLRVLPDATFTRSFVSAVVGSAVATAGSALLSESSTDLDNLERHVEQLKSETREGSA